MNKKIVQDLRLLLNKHLSNDTHLLSYYNLIYTDLYKYKYNGRLYFIEIETTSDIYLDILLETLDIIGKDLYRVKLYGHRIFNDIENNINDKALLEYNHIIKSIEIFSNNISIEKKVKTR